MKILILLFAIITFVLMAADPRREDFEVRDADSKKTNTKSVNLQENESQEPEHDQEDV